MTVQRSDDAGRNLRSVWLGPQNAWRWPFDATFTEWGVGVGAFLVLSVAFWLVLPLGVFVVAVSFALVRLLRKGMTIGGRDWSRWYLVGFVAFFLLLFPSPALWLLPMPWWLAPLSAVAGAMLLVRRARPYLDGNRPVAYWVGTWQRIARGPRPQRPLAVIHPAILVAEEDAVPDDDASRLLLAVAQVDMKEVLVARYTRTVTTTVEAMLWAPRQGRHETSANVLAWLGEHGFPYALSKVRYRKVDDDVYGAIDVLTGATLTVEGLGVVPDDHVILRDVDSDVFPLSVVARTEFAARQFEPVKALPR